MQIKISERFENELEVILDFIALDNTNQAIKFYDDLLEKIYLIPNTPYAYRKRNLLNISSVRELIFKGYTVPFIVNEEKDEIFILGIFNQNMWE